MALSWSVSTRILAMAVLAIVLLAIMAVFSTTEVARIYAAASETRNVWLPRTVALDNIQFMLLRYHTTTIRKTIATDPDEVKGLDAEFVEMDAEIPKIFEDYRSTITSEREASLWDNYVTKWRSYLKARGAIMEAVDRGQLQTAQSRIAAARPPLVDSFIALAEVIKVNNAGADAAAATAATAYSQILSIIVALGVVSVSVMLLFARWIIRRVTKPIIVLSDVMRHLAGGSLDQTIPFKNRTDEIGRMATAVEIFRNSAVRRAELESKDQAERAIREARQGKIETSTGRFQTIIVQMIAATKAATSKLRQSSQALTENAERTRQQTASVSTATRQATGNVGNVSSASLELSASIAEISRQMQTSATIAQTAVRESEDAGREIDGLAEAVQRIGEVVNIINEIASRTNLLALNATIESARAGDAGKGFAVVANEVKLLAGQTARATDDIRAQINAVQRATQAAVQAIGGINSTIGQINDLSVAIAGAVEQQSAATSEIARNIEQASVLTRDVAGNITVVASESENTGRMATDVHGTANELLVQSERLETEVAAFLQEVRAA